MNVPSNAIGIFDSGLGGLTIWKTCKELLPFESYLYVADHAFVPYGSKSTHAIVARVLVCLKWLVSKQCKLIVVACNTATVAGIEHYRRQLPNIPIVGVVPVIKKAAEMTKTNSIAVLSTPFTAKSNYQKDLIARYAKGKNVTVISSSALVPIIESGNVGDARVMLEIKYLMSTLERDTDTLVLGCTHYPYIAPILQKTVGKRINLVDSSGAVARQVKRVLTGNNQLSNLTQSKDLFYTTGNSRHVTQVAKKLIQNSVEFSHITL